ncbi:MAG: hypothetical protein WAP35_06395 [Solirubrobacterales bacterium]
MHKKQLSMALAIAGLLTALYMVAPAAGTAAAACTPATNIEAIIDDSGSMSSTDSANNRSEALKILISKSANAKKTLGAVEFGSGFGAADPAATTVFAPALIGSGAAAMKAALTANILSDHGGTDYNAGFDQAKIDNPNANARIFLTDGGHNSGTYLNGHQGGPPTYVVGLGTGLLPDDQARLQTIAAETGGQYFPGVTAGTVNSTMNQIDAALNCQAIAKTFTDQFAKIKKPKTKSTKISSKTRSVDLVLSWENPLDAFTISGVKLNKKGKDPKLSIKKTSGTTFLTVHVGKLKKGTLRFKLVATKLGSVFPGSTTPTVTLTTQATQNRTK